MKSLFYSLTHDTLDLKDEPLFDVCLNVQKEEQFICSRAAGVCPKDSSSPKLSVPLQMLLIYQTSQSCARQLLAT